jgi:hypothetical protein
MWFIHILGGRKAILLLLQYAMYIALFILYWKLCHVPKFTIVPVKHLGCSSISYWVCSQKTYCITFICICSIVGRDMPSLFLMEIYSLCMDLFLFNTKVQFYIKSLFN